ncbi:MAG: hypothetical protein LBT48_02130 [Prevotellaceae bacterium]|nr:hypothetical protein [Prevotellaceae bacterium]
MKTFKIVSVACFMSASIGCLAEKNTGINLYESGMYGAAKVYFQKHLNLAATPQEKAEAYYYLGESYLKINLPDSARFSYTQGAEALPDSPFNKIGLEKIKMKEQGALSKEQYKVQDGLFKEILKVDKKNVRLPLAVAEAYLYAGDTVRALEYIKQAKKADSKNGLPYLLEGDVLLAKKSYNEAGKNYDMAVYFSPDLIGAYLRFAKMYMPINDEIAREKLAIAKDVNPSFSGADRLLGEMYEKQGKYNDAVQAYSKFIDEGNFDEDDLLRYAGLFYSNNQYDKMMPIVESILRTQPDNRVANRLQAYGLAEIEPGEKSISAIKKFVENTPEDKLLVQDYLTYAKQLSANKYYTETAEIYEKVIAKDNTKKALYKDIAEAYTKAKQWEQATYYFELYLNYVETPDPTITFQIGRNYYNMASADSVKLAVLASKADSTFASLAAIVPDSHLGYFWQARTQSLLDPLITQGLAQPHYEKVIELVVEQPDKYKSVLLECYKYLGYYYYVKAAEIVKTNNNKVNEAARVEYLKAKEYFSKALELNPADTDTLAELEKLKTIK